MTVYDREILEAIRAVGRELYRIEKQLYNLNKQLEAAPRPLTTRDLPDLETYFEQMEDDHK